MGTYKTQFGSTVNVPDEVVERYRSNGFVVREGQEPKPRPTRRARKKASEPNDE
ncbi:DUF7302 family protein [Rhodococcus pyridinivorans]